MDDHEEGSYVMAILMNMMLYIWVECTDKSTYLYGRIQE